MSRLPGKLILTALAASSIGLGPTVSAQAEADVSERWRPRGVPTSPWCLRSIHELSPGVTG